MGRIAPADEVIRLLYEVGRAVNSTLELSQVLATILSHSTALFSADAGSVMLLNDRGELTIEASQGLPERVVRSTRVPPGEGIAGYVAQTGEMLLLDGKVRDPRFAPLVDRQDPIRSALCVPLRRRDRILGVLMVRRAGDEPFTDAQLHLLAAIGEQVAIAIENARLYDEERRRAQELAATLAALSLEDVKLRAILRSLADGVVVTDAQGRVALLNVVAERLFGVGSAEAGGQPLAQLFDEPSAWTLLQDVEGSAPPPDRTLERDGAVLSLRAAALRREGGPIEGLVLILHDVTALHQMGKLKSEFVSMVSHELKTPLTSIQGFVDLMLLRDVPRERSIHYLSIVKSEARRLVRLINNLLNLSRLESGQFEIRRESLAIADVLSPLAAAFREQHASHALVVEAPPDLPLIDADRDLLVQVVGNLVDNAVKYSPDGGVICIQASSRPGWLEVSVTDQGMGIPQDQLPYVFEKFYRVNDAHTREMGGTGLGLANVKYIVEAHGGAIDVRSAVGHGSTFTVSLPLRASENLSAGG